MQTVSMPAVNLRGFLKNRSNLLSQMAAAATGFVMSGASILTATAPFGVAWAGAVPPGQSLAAATGAVLGYALLLRGDGALRYLAAVVLLMGLRWAFSFLSSARRQALSPLMAGVAVGTTGLAAAISGGTAYDYILMACEAAVTVTAALLFARARRGVETGAPLAGTTGVCSGLALAVLYMGLSGLTLGGVSLARVAAIWLILCCGCYAGTGAGAVAGIGAGLASALSGQPALLVACAAGGLAAGIFSPLGRVGGALALTAVGALGLAASDALAPLPFFLLECAAGSALLMLTPASLPRALGIAATADAAQGDMMRRAVTARLNRTRDALSDIAGVTDQVSRRIEQLRADPLDRFINRAADGVCRGCKASPRCWQSRYNDTIEALTAVFSAARLGEGATVDDLPERFECPRAERLVEALNRQASLYAGRQTAQRQAAQMRTVASDQFEGMSALLDSIGRELAELRPAPPALTTSIEGYLAASGAQPLSVCCCLDALDRLAVIAELPARRAARLDLARATADLSELAAQELAIPEELPDGDLCRLWWSARPLYDARFEHRQRAAGAARLCGDSCHHFTEPDGRAAMLLSDGMGVGGSAAVDATMTTSLLSRLVRAGVRFDAALRLVNAALLSGGGEERLCTVDACLLDLYSGRMDVYKAGAAPTYILRQGRAAKIESASLPAGILGGAEAQQTSLTLGEGDVVVMVSDGLTETGADWIPSELAALAGRPLDELCDGLLDTAAVRRVDGREDDMTVMAAVITKA